jgi:hypothetical protein
VILPGAQALLGFQLGEHCRRIPVDVRFPAATL